MVMKCAPVCLLALALLGSLCDAQWGGSQKPGNPKYQKPSPPVRPEPKQVPQPPQIKQSFEKPLTWTYPEDPKPEPVPDVAFELRHPVAASTVSVECRENIAHVKVMKDMFGIGQLINPADLTLGNCAAVAEDPAAQVLIYESELHDCASVLTLTQESLIYTFTLNYDPQPVGESPVVRTSKAAVIVECYYPRKHNVSSLPLEPLWIPFSAVKVSEEFLYFTLKLMTDDWQNQRPSYQYYLGNEIHIEAEVKQYFHVPLRVFVDNCVATLSPDPNTSPKYGFIDNHGCLLDARITGSKSKFLPRTADNKLHIELEAFRFQGADSGLMYITCHLKATYIAHPLDAEHRACSFIGGWKEASGVDAVCGSCESAGFGPVVSSGGGSSSSSGSFGGGMPSMTTPIRKSRDVAKNDVFEWEGDVTLGPMLIEERVMA